jgi:hypothetical protein
MKKLAYRLLTLAGLMVTMLVASANAQVARSITADIPFNFVVKDIVLPAGKYFLEPIRLEGAEIIKVRNANAHIKAIVMTQLETARANQAGVRLVFNRYGDQYFLSQIMGFEENVLFQLPKSRIEADATPVVIAGNLISPTSMAHDEQTGSLFVTEIFTGRVIKIVLP